jgi:hypothetical protein
MLGQSIYSHMTGTYTPATTGLYNITIYNNRAADHQDLLQNYIDDITLVPLTTDFTSDTLQFSASTAGQQARFELDAGPAWAGWKYIVLLSRSGNWPGTTNNGVWLPLKVDNLTYKSISLANKPVLPHSKATLDASGKALAGLRLVNAMGATWVGRELNVAYILYQGPGFTPISYASMPLTILFIP